LYNHGTEHGLPDKPLSGFVDFENGFDSINRNKVWEIMNRYGIP
jgi:hypothetical protein